MEKEDLEKLNLLMASIETELNIATIIFVILSFSITFVLRKKHKLSIKECLLFIIGIKRIKMNWRERTVHIASIAIPVFIAAAAILPKLN